MSSAVPAYPPGSTPVPPGYVPAVPAAPVDTARPPATQREEEIRVYGHTNLFYWWPIWALGFLMAALTYIDGHLMAVVPQGTKVEQKDQPPGGPTQEILVAPPGTTVPPADPHTNDPNPKLHVAANNNYGVIFIGALLFVAIVTNITLRGQASVIALTVLIIISLTLALAGWWDDVFQWLGGLDVRMNAGGYLALSIPLFLIWLFATFVYDHYTYMIVTRGQVRIKQAIGDGEIAVDTSNVVLDKKRNDLFRHWLLGCGSGDLHVKTGGPANLDFELTNVLFVGSKLARIQNLIREKEVEQTATA
jgi:hypothetical protein